MMEDGLLPPPNEVLGVEFKDVPPVEKITTVTATRGVDDQQQPEDEVVCMPNTMRVMILVSKPVGMCM